MFFKHIYDESLAQGSYFIGCQATKEAIVIDAKRDIDTYLEIAKKNNFKIKHITETHIHADYLCGSRELAKVTGATLYLSDEGGSDWQYEFPHTGVKDGDIIKVGNLTFKVIHTPGHTPESISFLLTDHPASDAPTMFFTGDFVFVGDVGRPDLLEKAAGVAGTMNEGAQQMYNSLKKFMQVPDYVQVWPAHGAGSACGKALGAVPSSTVGYEKLANWALQYENQEAEFIDRLLDGQPEPPKYFAMMKRFNKVDRPLLTEVPKHPKLAKEDFLEAYNNGMTVIDTRKKEAFAAAHLPGSLNISNMKSFATWAGWLLDFDEQFILVAEDNEMEDLSRKLMRVGLDNVYGYISNIEDLGIEPEAFEVIDYNEFNNYVGKENVQIIDVRNTKEFGRGHVEGAQHLFVGTLADHLAEIDKEKELVIHCQSGVRSAIAQSVLAKHGFKNVKNYTGGMQDWLKHNAKVVLA